MARVGILAIQGDFFEHRRLLESLGAEVREVRLAKELDEVDGLIIPGGESTTIVQLIDIYGFRSVLSRAADDGLPIWGTCAGMIVMAKGLSDRRPDPLKLMDIEVSRNAFGRQVDSFEADLSVAGLDETPFRAVFIRAPVVDEMGPGVEVLSTLDDGRPVAVRQGVLLATAFHPELTGDSRMHRLFADMAEGSA